MLRFIIPDDGTSQNWRMNAHPASAAETRKPFWHNTSSWGGYAGLAKKDGISRPDQPELLINPQSCPKDQNCIKIPVSLAQFCSWREEYD
jgi:hypothetical protein